MLHVSRRCNDAHVVQQLKLFANANRFYAPGLGSNGARGTELIEHSVSHERFSYISSHRRTHFFSDSLGPTRFAINPSVSLMEFFEILGNLHRLLAQSR